jgi:hypothetical protein
MKKGGILDVEYIRLESGPPGWENWKGCENHNCKLHGLYKRGVFSYEEQKLRLQDGYDPRAKGRQ